MVSQAFAGIAASASACVQAYECENLFKLHRCSQVQNERRRLIFLSFPFFSCFIKVSLKFVVFQTNFLLHRNVQKRFLIKPLRRLCAHFVGKSNCCFAMLVQITVKNSEHAYRNRDKRITRARWLKENRVEKIAVRKSELHDVRNL